MVKICITKTSDWNFFDVKEATDCDYEVEIYDTWRE